MGRPKKRRKSAAKGGPTTPAAPSSTPTTVADPPGEGINRKRPALLLAMGVITLAWLTFLTWIALNRLYSTGG